MYITYNMYLALCASLPSCRRGSWSRTGGECWGGKRYYGEKGMWTEVVLSLRQCQDWGLIKEKERESALPQ